MRLLIHFFKSLLLLTLLNTFQLAHSQENLSKPAWSIGANPYYGAVFKHRAGQPRLMFTGLYGLELYATKLTNGKRRWEKMYGYPDIGFSLAYYNYNFPEVLGEVVEASTYLDFSVNKKKKNQIRFNLGTGLVYSTKRWDFYDNPDNNAISAKISFVLRGTIHYEIPLKNSNYLNFNFGFRHYSNGRFNVPNAGMNFLTTGIGIRRIIKPKQITYQKDTNKDFDKKYHLNVMTSKSWREVTEIDIQQNAYTFSIYGSKGITKYNAVLVGMDRFLYDEVSIRKELSIYGYDKSTKPEREQIAITVGTEVYLGNLWFLFQHGFYLKKPYDLYPPRYQRFGLKYFVHKDVFIQASLKTHSSVADMVEFGLGVKI